MADILRFKPITIEDVFKGVDKSYSTAKVAHGGPQYGLPANASEIVTWHYVERTNEGNAWSTTTDDLKNLFHSFGISREDEEDWFKVFNVNDWYNAKRMIIATIPQSGCGTYIDGSTLQINVPVGSGSNEYVTLYGSTFNGYPDPVTAKQMAKEYENGNVGGAFCYLFGTTNNSYGQGDLPAGTFGTYGDNHPYTGNTNGNVNPNTGIRDFDPDMASDPTTTSWATKGTHYGATHWRRGDTGRDYPYGMAFLERGIFVIFDTYGRDDLIANTNMSGVPVWNSNGANFSAYTSTGATVKNSNTAHRKSVHFEGSIAQVNASIYYRTVTQEYKTIYFCHAGQSEFNSTSNHTYNHKKAYFRPDEADSLWITEIGLYDDEDSLLAYAKLSEPVEKNKLETMTFKVELQL